jgi:hypothetical protein
MKAGKSFKSVGFLEYKDIGQCSLTRTQETWIGYGSD